MVHLHCCSNTACPHAPKTLANLQQPGNVVYFGYTALVESEPVPQLGHCLAWSLSFFLPFRRKDDQVRQWPTLGDVLTLEAQCTGSMLQAICA